MKILFVCLGNICRSPLAEGIAKDYIKKHSLDIKVDSCATGSWHIGETPCEGSQKVALQNGIDISKHKARQITKQDLESFDIFVALDSKNFLDLKSMGAKNVVKLGDFGYDSEDVPDPYFFNGFEGFDKVFKMCKDCVYNMLQELILK